MSNEKREIDWSKVDGALPKPKRLHLEEEDDGLYHCPVPACSHNAFGTQRGCRKHVKRKHRWYLYFDEQPEVNSDPSPLIPVNEEVDDTPSIRDKRKLPVACFDISKTIGKEFENWLTGSGGGGKTPKQARQILRKSFKYLKFCCEEDDEVEELSWDIVDFCLSSPSFIFKFVDAMDTEWGLGHAGRLGYLDSISDLIDFRKIQGPSSESIMYNLNCTEVYLKRARKTVSKMMRLQWTNDLDIETLEAKGHWATMEELLQVITYHLPRYESVLKVCRETPDNALPSDLTFATKFVAVYLFIQVKGSRPMTYQYLTVEMVESAKTNGGFIHQKKFKTTSKYGFDSLYLTDTSMQVLDGYITAVRPLLKPECEYVLVNRKGGQHNKIGQLMSKLVFDATGKYIHPTRYRQIVETASRKHLDTDEQDTISEDQKHSSVVAKVHYQKKRSKEIATKAHECLMKLQGTKATELTNDVHTRLAQLPVNSCSDVQPLPETSEELPSESTTTPEKSETSSSQCTPSNANVEHKRKKILLFTPDEDRFLKAGIQKHGYGQWTSILKDPTYKFQPGRTTNSLLNRAMRKFK